MPARHNRIDGPCAETASVSKRPSFTLNAFAFVMDVNRAIFGRGLTVRFDDSSGRAP
jgi:hypothetical protein